MAGDIKQGGRAFPWCGDLNETPTIELGMTLRSYFAAKAMQVVLSDGYFREKADTMGYSEFADEAAAQAFAVADAMLKAGGHQ